MEKLRELFLGYLTKDSESQDARRKEFNQAIFIDPDDEMFGGGQVFNGTDLDMVMDKFDKAVKEYQRIYGKDAVNNLAKSKKTI